MAQPSQRPSEGLFLANQRVELLQGARRATIAGIRAAAMVVT